jgi:hypothetical protein
MCRLSRNRSIAQFPQWARWVTPTGLFCPSGERMPTPRFMLAPSRLYTRGEQASRSARVNLPLLAGSVKPQRPGDSPKNGLLFAVSTFGTGKSRADRKQTWYPFGCRAPQILLSNQTAITERYFYWRVNRQWNQDFWFASMPLSIGTSSSPNNTVGFPKCVVKPMALCYSLHT